MLEKVKLALRVTSNAFDSEILDLIAACKSRFLRAGVTFDENDATHLLALKLFCKAEFGLDKDTESYKQSFENALGLIILTESV